MRQPSKLLQQEEIEVGLAQLGLGKGDAVEVHSSLSSFGTVAGGAPTVIQALMNVVGPAGALIMSAYRVSPAVPLTATEQTRGMTWKVRLLQPDSDEKTGMGAISDAFRRWPGVVLGTGPYPVCAWGRDAHLYSQGYAHLLAIDGWALLMGVDIHRCSSMHLAEKVELPHQIAQRFELPQDLRNEYPPETWAIGYGSTPDDPWMKVWVEAHRRGFITTRHIGGSECHLFKARAVVGIYEVWRHNDPLGLYGVPE